MIKTQKEFFDQLIISTNKSKSVLCNEIADITNAAVRTIEKWFSSVTIIDYEQLSVICKNYSSSVECLLKDRENEVMFHIWLLDLNKLERFYMDLCAFAIKLEETAKLENPMMCIVVNNLRLFHFVGFEHLPYLILYYYELLDKEEDDVLSYEAFSRELNKFDFQSVFNSIHESLEKMPTREIWEETVMDGLLFQIQELSDRNYFDDPASRSLILVELMGFVNEVFDRVARVAKPSGARFDFFKKPYSDGRGFLLAKRGDEPLFSMKMDPHQVMITRNPHNVKVQYQSFKNVMYRSMALGLGDQSTRIELKTLFITKIQLLMERP